MKIFLRFCLTEEDRALGIGYLDEKTNENGKEPLI